MYVNVFELIVIGTFTTTPVYIVLKDRTIELGYTPFIQFVNVPTYVPAIFVCKGDGVVVILLITSWFAT